MDRENRQDVGGNLLLAQEVYRIVGCAFEVLNGLGHGGKEKFYENALTVEFEIQGIPFDQQRSFPAVYKGQKVGTLIPDLLAFDSVLIETKAAPEITDLHRGQIINYLKITQLRVGLILNFFRPKLEWERIVL